MAQKDRTERFRVDPELSSAIDEFVAAAPGSNRSEILRALLWQALADDANRGATRQALYDFARRRSVLAARLSRVVDESLREAFPVILAETFGENADDFIE